MMVEPEEKILYDYEEGAMEIEMNRSEILSKADSLISFDRNKEYGNASKNFSDIAKGWSILFGVEITSEQVSLGMAWVKMSRLIKTPYHLDSWCDLAGYAALGGEVSQLEEEE
jgi:hypothetical protein